MRDDMQISIVGAGIGGLVLGRCLLHRGIRSTLLEKSRASTNRNDYGITLQGSTFRSLLDALNLDERVFRRSVAVDATVGGQGRVFVQDHHHRRQSLRINDEDVRVNRNRFESVLAEGLNIKWEHEVKGITAGNTNRGADAAVELTFGNGMQHGSDVVVGADGPHSAVRKTTAPEEDFEILPYAVYNGKRRISAETFHKSLAYAFGGGNVVEQRIGNALFLISINDRNQDEASLSYTYSRPAKQTDDPLFNPSRSTAGAKNIPEELFDEIDSLRERLSEPLATVFETDAMRDDRLLNWLMRTVHVDIEKVKNDADKGIVLMGDAIHAEPILGGNGANEAILDAMKLADVIAEKSERGLSDFYQARSKAWSEGATRSEQRIKDMHGRVHLTI